MTEEKESPTNVAEVEEKETTEEQEKKEESVQLE